MILEELVVGGWCGIKELTNDSDDYRSALAFETCWSKHKTSTETSYQEFGDNNTKDAEQKMFTQHRNQLHLQNVLIQIVGAMTR
jgi:hypothetical protein